MIAVIDYGVGNLFSLSSSLSYLGLENENHQDPARLETADRIILPGVGAFADAMRKLEETGLVPVLKQQVQKKSRCWASALECSCCLTRAMSTASTRAWG